MIELVKYLLTLDITEKVLTLIMMIGTSLGIRMLLDFLGQKWIKTVAQTATLCVLPVLTYIITNVISGNIALSLGMVGALSIVRFRNPVRSPLELTVYFGAITMGIAASVSLLWFGFLIVSILMVSVTLVITNILSKAFLKKDFFINSFSEGNSQSTLEVITAEGISELDDNKFLRAKQITKDKINYYLSANSFEELKGLSKTCEGNERIISIQLSK